MSLQYINGKWVETNTGVNVIGSSPTTPTYSGIKPLPTKGTNTYGLTLPSPTTQVNTGLNQGGQTLYSNVPAPTTTTTIKPPTTTTTIKPPTTSTYPPPIVGTPQTTTPTPTVTNTPVIPAPSGSVGSLLNDFNPSGYTSSEQSAIDSYNKNLQKSMNATFDPNAVYRQNLQMYQAQIDAINNIYNDQLNQSRIQNAPEFASRVGSQTAMAARGGLLGSDPGKAMVDQQHNANQKEQAAQDAVFAAQRNDAISRIYGKVADSVTAAKAAFDETKKKSSEEFIAAIKARPEERKKQTSNFIKELIASGIDISDLTPDEIKKFASKIGVDAQTLKAEYNTQFAEQESAQNEAATKAAKAEADLAKTQADTAQTEKETSLLGQMTPYQRAQLEQTAANNKMSGPEYIRTSASEMGNIIDSSVDGNGFLTPSQYKEAKKQWVNESGLTPEQFDSYFADKAYTKDVDEDSPYTLATYGISPKGVKSLAETEE